MARAPRPPTTPPAMAAVLDFFVLAVPSGFVVSPEEPLVEPPELGVAGEPSALVGVGVGAAMLPPVAGPGMVP
jgi:hypothetical protein